MIRVFAASQHAAVEVAATLDGQVEAMGALSADAPHASAHLAQTNGVVSIFLNHPFETSVNENGCANKPERNTIKIACNRSQENAIPK